MGVSGRGQAWQIFMGGLAVAILAIYILGAVLLEFDGPWASETGVSETVSQTRSSIEKPYAAARRAMVQRQLIGRDITDERVLYALGRVPRHLFVPPAQQHMAYEDHPLPIGHNQTISQPYIVALMTQLVRLKPEARALDIGTGSGYQAAVLAGLCKEVYSIEIVEPLAEEATRLLDRLGYDNVTVRHGDGYRGWPEHAPFDAIIVAAAAEEIPGPLVDQLAPGGRLVMPVGNFFQDLILVEKRSDGTIRRENLGGVAFVPLTGEAQQ
ncbi:MAG TPA: protein-L-isoaspartate(D-aspartate) O-methyltransferase [Thermoguttaceae bacterium]|nr:protein-L-isoaspartate(D-aspartate) O-methyltransferase [Thermoguttaceae bacterium]